MSFGGEWKQVREKYLTNDSLDCFGSIIACMAFALLIELSRGIDLYLRHYSIVGKNNHTLSLITIRRRR